MTKTDSHLLISLDDRASAFLRSLPDIFPASPGAEVPPLPADLLHVSASPQSDGSVGIVMRPSVAALKWAARAAAEHYPAHVRSVKVDLPK